MNLKAIYWHFDYALTPRLCKHILDYALTKKSSLGVTGVVGQNRDLKKDPLKKKEQDVILKKRKSEIVWLHEQWIYRELRPFIVMANKNAGWNFEWEGSEDIQFTKYAKGHYYGWHQDSWNEPYDNNNAPHLRGRIRKLSMVCQLSNPNDYTGGDLEFATTHDSPNIKVIKSPRQKGSITVFPSFVWHRVRPLTQGNRYSLVMWNLGVPFK